MPDACRDITPDTKIGELLERWPQLEAVLIEISPHFRALRNPVLRRTLARVASVRQASQVSGVALGTIVARLRSEVGQAPLPVEDAADAAGAPRPAWASPEAVRRRHDARPELEAGRHPLADVLRGLEELGAGDVYELVTPFHPAPLVDTAAARGYRAYSAADAEGAVHTWFSRAP